MIAVSILLAVLAIAVFAALYLLGCRTGAEGWDALAGKRYAHRGLHNADAPENSLAAFRRAVEHGYGAELDVHLLRDGSLAVFHDSDLKRMTGRDGFLEDLCADDLNDCRLAGTEHVIPLFSEVLALFEGTGLPLIVELKSFRDDHDALGAAVAALLDRYQGPYCVESFDPRCVRWFRRHRPKVIRGQLSQDFVHDPGKNRPARAFAATWLLMNFMSRPDFIAYRFEHRAHAAPRLCRALFGVHMVYWTIRSHEDLLLAEREGALPIFEKFIPTRQAAREP